MTFHEVKELHEMGFTPEQITQLNLGSDPEPQPEQQPEQEPETKPEPQQETQPETQLEPDPVTQRLESMEKTINDFIVSMQKNNLKTASVNLLPDDQIDAGANTALSELIRPTIKQKED